MKKIKAGYLIEVTSWENDADNYSTETLDGLTREECRFVKELCELLDDSNCNDVSKYGNMLEYKGKKIDAFNNAMIELVKRYPLNQISKLLDWDIEKELNDESKGRMQDALYDLLYNIGLTGGEFHTRVCESANVYYCPDAIVMEQIDL